MPPPYMCPSNLNLNVKDDDSTRIEVESTVAARLVGQRPSATTPYREPVMGIFSSRSRQRADRASDSCGLTGLAGACRGLPGLAGACPGNCGMRGHLWLAGA